MRAAEELQTARIQMSRARDEREHAAAIEAAALEARKRSEEKARGGKRKTTASMLD